MDFSRQSQSFSESWICNIFLFCISHSFLHIYTYTSIKYHLYHNSSFFQLTYRRMYILFHLEIYIYKENSVRGAVLRHFGQPLRRNINLSTSCFGFWSFSLAILSSVSVHLSCNVGLIRIVVHCAITVMWCLLVTS